MSSAAQSPLSPLLICCQTSAGTLSADAQQLMHESITPLRQSIGTIIAANRYGLFQILRQSLLTFYYQLAGDYLLIMQACRASWQPYRLAIARCNHGSKAVNLLRNQA